MSRLAIAAVEARELSWAPDVGVVSKVPCYGLVSAWNEEFGHDGRAERTPNCGAGTRELVNWSACSKSSVPKLFLAQ